MHKVWWLTDYKLDINSKARTCKTNSLEHTGVPVLLQTCNWKVPGSIFGRDTGYPKVFVVFLSPAR